ncbi:MAG: hypothetical protein GTN84_10605 [Hydrogenophaga sp.]|uniref:hypothetical protein n=1 Tax=Hydrogenophaga sp. TaxID=1904254 RepID=UPI0016A4F7B2|nr:hypothetical protein [Hydrogenophaga sp.]NIM41542.1 hypothetical protein [Hydrogenophaga sp.]NIN26850.1 hypothetical protein [Hydrogenophaga sp.]NIN31551.1 hypothetical protein [Hydrogenophaga sp.]NIN55784.1 hypothetical protein [Hydrogenophaga sp.]NIO51952.1 hypothetical protein [Hydrogenophaga sp.]
MAIPWIAALKIIPWGDVIEHAPKVLNAARKLLDKQKAPTVPVPPSPPTDLAAEPPTLEALRDRLVEARQLIDQQSAAQQQMAQTLSELAEQNARLVEAVQLLRVRTRVLIVVAVVLVVGVAVLLAR